MPLTVSPEVGKGLGSVAARAVRAVGEGASRLVTPLMDRMANRYSAEGEYLKNSFMRYSQEADKLMNSKLSFVQKFNKERLFSADDWQAVQRERKRRQYVNVYKKAAEGSSKAVPIPPPEPVPLNERQSVLYDLYDVYYKGLLQDQLEDGSFILDARGKYRPPEEVDGSYPVLGVSGKVRDVLLNSPDSPQAKQLKADYLEDFLRMNPGASVKSAERAMEAELYREVAGSSTKKSDLNRLFSPLDRPYKGTLPLSWQEPMQTTINRHLALWSKSMAYYRTMMKDEFAARALGIARDGQGEVYKGTKFWSDGGFESEIFNKNEPVRRIEGPDADMFRNYLANDMTLRKGDWLEKTAGLANAGRIGVLSGVRDMTSTAAHVWELAGIRDAGTVLKSAARTISDGRFEFFNEGGGRMVRASDFFAPETASGFLVQSADLLRKVQGREMLEVGVRTWQYLVGKELVKKLMSKNSKQAAELLETIIGKGWRDIPKDELLSISGRRFMEMYQGGYGPLGLPAWMLSKIDSTTGVSFVRGVFSLGRWSLERFNNWRRTTWEPAKNGNLLPLLRSLTMGMLTAEGYNYLLGRFFKRPTDGLTLQEMVESGGDDLMYSLFAKLQLVAYGGAMSDFGFLAASAWNGERIREYRFPASMIFDDLMTRTQQVFSATRNGEISAIEAVPEYLFQMLLDNFQAASVIWRMLENEPMELREAQRLYRAYQREQGVKRFTGAAGRRNPFSAVSKFGRAPDWRGGAADRNLPGVVNYVNKTGKVPSLPALVGNDIPFDVRKGPGEQRQGFGEFVQSTGNKDLNVDQLRRVYKARQRLKMRRLKGALPAKNPLMVLAERRRRKLADDASAGLRGLGGSGVSDISPPVPQF